MDRLINSQIPYHEFEEAKRLVFSEYEQLMTEQLHSQHPRTNKLSIKADVRSFLAAHTCNRTLLEYGSPTRVSSPVLVTPSMSGRRRSGHFSTPRNSRRRSVISTLRRSPTSSIGSTSGTTFRVPTLRRARPPLTRTSAVASSSSSNADIPSRLYSTPRTPRPARTNPVTPLSRILRTPQSGTPRAPQSRTLQPRASLIPIGRLKDAYKACNGRKNDMVLSLMAMFPSIDIADIEFDVDNSMQTLKTLENLNRL